jgi:hypothetical protein
MIYDLYGIVNNVFESRRLIASGCDILRLEQIKRDMSRFGYKKLYITERRVKRV